MADPILKVGDVHTWSSGGRGGIKEKRATVCAMIPANADPFSVYPQLKEAARVRVRFSGKPSHAPRYLFVAFEGKRQTLTYYAPAVNVIDGRIQREKDRAPKPLIDVLAPIESF